MYIYMCVFVAAPQKNESFGVCCSVLRCVAVCCSALQCVTVFCRVLQCVAVCCSNQKNEFLESFLKGVPCCP